ncbi:hypothetical protein OG269_28645 [Streptomyces microflavus]|nr:hypothetical protein OG269_28645 [Streptomyces microflavus]
MLDAVEVGDQRAASAAGPVDLGHDVLTTRPQPQRAELTAGGQTIGGEAPPVDGNQRVRRF